MSFFQGFTCDVNPCTGGGGGGAAGGASVDILLSEHFFHSTNSFIQVPELFIEDAEPNGYYWFFWHLVWQCNGISTTGIQFRFNGPAAPVIACAAGRIFNTDAGPATTWTETNMNTYLTVAANASGASQNLDLAVEITGLFINGPNTGDFILEVATITNGQQLSIRQNSLFTYKRYHLA